MDEHKHHPHQDANLDGIVERLRQHPEGITLTPEGIIPALSQGYLVSVTNNRFESIDEQEVRTVLAQLKRNPLAAYLGAWYSRATDSSYLDASAHLFCRKDALLIARRYGQEAIYDIRNRRCIEVRYQDQRVTNGQC